MPLKISEPSGTSQSICTRTFRNLPEYLNLTDYLHGKPPQPHQVSASEPSKTSQGTVSAPKPSGTSPPTCTLTFWNLPAPEPCATSLAICNKPSETSPGICTGTQQNLTIYLQWNPPEPQHGICEVPAICTGTLRNLTRYLHRNPPEPQQGICTGTLSEPSGTLPGTCCWSCTGSHQS